MKGEQKDINSYILLKYKELQIVSFIIADILLIVQQF